MRTRSAVPSLWFCLINGLLVGYRPPLSVLPTCFRPLAATNGGGGGSAAISPRGLRNFGKLRSNSRLRPLSTQKRRGRSNGWPEATGGQRTSGFYERTIITWFAMTADSSRSIPIKTKKKCKHDRWQLYQKDRIRLKGSTDSAYISIRINFI